MTKDVKITTGDPAIDQAICDLWADFVADHPDEVPWDQLSQAEQAVMIAVAMEELCE